MTKMHKMEIVTPHGLKYAEEAARNRGIDLEGYQYDGQEADSAEPWDTWFLFRIREQDLHLNDKHPLHAELDKDNTLVLVAM